MNSLRIATVLISLALPLVAQQSAPRASGSQYTEVGNLPVQKIGPNDLVGLAVSDAPEMSRTFRVGPDGAIHLPMLKQPIQAAGLLPIDLEAVVAGALVKEHLFTAPIVTVSVVEYQSRPIRVVGAFKAPLTFEASQPTTLLDAIARAGGFADNAGPEILVTRAQTGSDGQTTHLTTRILIADLMNNPDPRLNVRLEGGEEISLPEAGRVYVVGDVKKPGAYPIKEGVESSVFKAISLSEGLDLNAAKIAYIYRREAGATTKTEIPVELRKIMDRKADDVTLLPNDILYIADNRTRRDRNAALEKALAVGTGISSALIYALLK